MGKVRWKWRVAGTALAAGAIAVGACFPQNQCDYQYAEYCAVNAPDGAAPCMGQLLDPYTWQSGPIGGSYLNFGPNMTMLIHLRDGVTGQPLLGNITNIEGYVSPDRDANLPGNQFAPCAGNLCELSSVEPDGPDAGSNGPWAFDIMNDTCAQYYLRVVVTSTGPGNVAVADASVDAPDDVAAE